MGNTYVSKNNTGLPEGVVCHKPGTNLVMQYINKRQQEANRTYEQARGKGGRKGVFWAVGGAVFALLAAPIILGKMDKSLSLYAADEHFTTTPGFANSQNIDTLKDKGATFPIDSNYKGNVITFDLDSSKGNIITIDTVQDSQAKDFSLDSNNAGDTTRVQKKKIHYTAPVEDTTGGIDAWMGKYRKGQLDQKYNPLNITKEDFVKFSKDQQDAYVNYVDSVKTWRYLPQDREGYDKYQKYKAIFLFEAEQFQAIYDHWKDTTKSRIPESLKKANLLDSLQKFPDDLAYELPASLSEPGGDLEHHDNKIKHRIALKLLGKFSDMVAASESGSLRAIYEFRLAQIELACFQVYDSIYRKDTTFNPAHMLFFTFLVEVHAANMDSYEKNYDAISDALSFMFSNDLQRDQAAKDTKNVMALFFPKGWEYRLKEGTLYRKLTSKQEKWLREIEKGK